MNANPPVFAVQQPGPHETVVTHGDIVMLLYKERALGGYVRAIDRGMKQKPFERVGLSRAEKTRVNKFFPRAGY